MGRLPWAVLRLGCAGGGRARGPLQVWLWWERLALRLYRVEPVRPGGLFLFRIQRHRRRRITLADGSVVDRGDRVAELHLDNRALVRLRAEPGYATWRAVAILRADLAELTNRLAAGELGSVVALHGTSLLGSAGGVLGFEVRPAPRSLGMAFVRYFMAGVDAIYHPAGLARLRGRARQRRPVEVWMSAPRAPVRAAADRR